jgi:hypothetical protein
MAGIPRKILDVKRDGQGVDWAGEAYGTEVRRWFLEEHDAKNSRVRLTSTSINAQKDETIHSLLYL